MAPEQSPSHDPVVDFLRRWGPTVLVAIYHDSRKRKPIEAHRYEPGGEEAAWEWVRGWNEKQYGLYFHVNPTRAGFCGKAKKEDVSQVLRLHVDIDPRVGEDLAAEQERILGALREFVPLPSLIISSGRGYAGYWNLKEPVDADTAERCNRGLELALGGDSCWNVDRVMRTPGTINWPNEKKAGQGAVPREAMVVEWSVGLEYDVAAFPQADVPRVGSVAGGIGAAPVAAPAAPVLDVLGDPRLENLAGWAKVIIVHGRDPDCDDPKKARWSRSEWQWAASNEMARAKIDPAVHLAILLDPGFGISETILAHGGEKYARRQIARAQEAAASFVTNEEGNIIPHIYANIRLGLLKLGARFSYDEFADRYLIEGVDGTGPIVDDACIVRLHRIVQDAFHFTPKKIQFADAVEDLCREGAFHPVREYLAGLKWDGVGRIDTWLRDYAGVEDTPYSRAVGRIFLIAAVRRVRQPGCRFGKMLILEGGQGKGKSTLLRTLMPVPSWFSDEVPLSGITRELVEGTRGKWLLEEAELSTFGTAAVERLKAAITRQTDRARAAYARRALDIPRQFVLAGSTNEERYLEDRTGNIRFWSVRTSGWLRTEELVGVRDALWAEAGAREAAGESIDLEQELWDAAAAEQEKRMTLDPWEESLAEVLPADGGRILPEDLFIFVGLDAVKDRDKRAALRLGRIMRRLGWRYTALNFDGVVRRCWERPGMLRQLVAEVRADGRIRALVPKTEGAF